MAVASKLFVNGNPWAGMIPAGQLLRVCADVTNEVAGQSEAWFEAGQSKRNSFGLCLLDPTAPIWKPSIDSILLLSLIGDEGESFIPNAVAKAVGLRDRGGATLASLIQNNHLVPADSFRWDGAVTLKGTTAGGSGLSEDQDTELSAKAATLFNGMVGELVAEWHAAHPRPGHGWLNTANAVPQSLQLNDLLARYGAVTELDTST